MNLEYGSPSLGEVWNRLESATCLVTVSTGLFGETTQDRRPICCRADKILNLVGVSLLKVCVAKDNVWDGGRDDHPPTQTVKAQRS